MNITATKAPVVFHRRFVQKMRHYNQARAGQARSRDPGRLRTCDSTRAQAANVCERNLRRKLLGCDNG